MILRKMILRKIKEKMNSTWKRGKSILLLGPRQTGKTTLASEYTFDLNINFLSNKIRQSYETNPDLILKEVAALKSKSVPKILIDEVQKVPSVMDPIQYLIDQKKAQFFITGSSARKLKQQADINLLPGRVIYFRLDALSLEEAPCEDLDLILNWGQLPEVVLTEDLNNKEELLQTYVEIYLEDEIRKEANLRKLPDFYRFLKHAAEQSGHNCSYSGIAQDVGVSHVTVKSYYEILESTLIADRIEPLYSSKTRKKLIRSPKYLFFDMGVRRLAAKEGINPPQSVKGHLFEHWVGLEIIKYIRSHKKSSSLHFWQDPEVAEVDWVIQNNTSFFPIEVKIKEIIQEKDCKHLNVFLKEYPCPKGGFLIFTGLRVQKISDQITAYPWNQLPKLLRSLINNTP